MKWLDSLYALPLCSSAAAAVLGLLAVESSHAASDPLVSVSATFHDFSYRLVDLDTTDGTPPWIRFNETPSSQLSLAENGKILQSVTAGGFVSSPDAAALDNGMSSVSVLKNGFTAQTQITNDDLNGLTATKRAFSFSRSAGVFYGKDQVFLLGFSYTLSPQTQVEFAFNYEFKSESNLASYVGNNLVSGPGAPYGRLSGTGRAYVVFDEDYIGPANPGVFTLQAVSNKGLFSLQSDYDQSSTEPDNWDDHRTGPFIYAVNSGLSARATNDGSSELTSQFSVSMAVKASVAASAVPEPNALSLLLGGMSVAGWARRGKVQTLDNDARATPG